MGNTWVLSEYGLECNAFSRVQIESIQSRHELHSYSPKVSNWADQLIHRPHGMRLKYPGSFGRLEELGPLSKQFEALRSGYILGDNLQI